MKSNSQLNNKSKKDDKYKNESMKLWNYVQEWVIQYSGEQKD